MPEMTLRKSGALPDWYVIERTKHEGRSWLETTGPNTMALRCSSRLSDADVEGDAAEMRAIAHAIRLRTSAHFRRCAVVVDGDEVLLWSPRNSQTRGVISLHEADVLASEIDRVLAESMEGGGKSA